MSEETKSNDNYTNVGTVDTVDTDTTTEAPVHPPTEDVVYVGASCRGQKLPRQPGLLRRI